MCSWFFNYSKSSKGSWDMATMPSLRTLICEAPLRGHVFFTDTFDHSPFFPPVQQEHGISAFKHDMLIGFPHKISLQFHPLLDDSHRRTLSKGRDSPSYILERVHWCQNKGAFKGDETRA